MKAKPLYNAYQLVYNTMQSLTGSSDFLYFKALSLIEANELLGSVGAQKVTDAWNAVGMGICRKYLISSKNDYIPTVREIHSDLTIGDNCGIEIENTIIYDGKTNLKNSSGIIISGDFELKPGVEFEILK
jgi:hypothetical protein